MGSTPVPCGGERLMWWGQGRPAVQPDGGEREGGRERAGAARASAGSPHIPRMGRSVPRTRGHPVVPESRRPGQPQGTVRVGSNGRAEISGDVQGVCIGRAATPCFQHRPSCFHSLPVRMLQNRVLWFPPPCREHRSPLIWRGIPSVLPGDRCHVGSCAGTVSPVTGCCVF